MNFLRHFDTNLLILLLPYHMFFYFFYLILLIIPMIYKLSMTALTKSKSKSLAYSYNSFKINSEFLVLLMRLRI